MELNARSEETFEVRPRGNQKNVQNLLEIGYRRLTKIENFWTTEALPEVKKFFDRFKGDSVYLQVGDEDSSLETVILKKLRPKGF